MMYKIKYMPFISIVENCSDSIIWLKIDKRLSKSNDLFIACTYILPHTSSYYKLFDFDLFHPGDPRLGSQSLVS